MYNIIINNLVYLLHIYNIYIIYNPKYDLAYNHEATIISSYFISGALFKAW